MPSPLIWPINSITTTSASVGVTTTVVLAANPSRKMAVFVNDSNQPIYLALEDAAVLNQGIRLNKPGLGDSSYEINDNNLFLGAVNAIAVGGDKNLTVTEGT